MNSVIKKFIIKLNKDIFAISLISFVIFFFIEQIKPKFVMAYLNLNYLLLICLISGIVAILFEEPKCEEEQNPPAGRAGKQKKVSLGVLILLSIITFIIIMVFVWNLGIWGILVSLVAGVIVFLLGKELVADE